MSWIALSILAYFLIAVQVILDKFLISSEKISHPSVYAFYSGLMSISAFIFFPFGFHLISFSDAILSIFSGVIFVYGFLFLFHAIKKSEASQVVPVVGAVIPIVIYILSIFILNEKLKSLEIVGVLVLISGGLIISFNFTKKTKDKFFIGLYPSILAGAFLAVSYVGFKYFYERDNFVNVYIWTRFGLMFGALSLLLNRSWRKFILGSIMRVKNPSRENKSSGIIFIFNKTLGGIGSMMKEYATAIGSVTIVNALISFEYAFIFILGLALSYKIPKVFQERKDWTNIIQKVSAIVVIALGTVLVSGFYQVY